MNNPLIHMSYVGTWAAPMEVICGGSGSGLYNSQDGGITWVKIHEGLPAELGKMAIAVCRSNSDKVSAVDRVILRRDLGFFYLKMVANHGSGYLLTIH
ncbi:MAG: hypothetical protein IPJ13_07980 [Saprospiraceae bacterium]|nr:hypothetical protein [Saprospiraceae bacterium]